MTKTELRRRAAAVSEQSSQAGLSPRAAQIRAIANGELPEPRSPGVQPPAPPPLKPVTEFGSFRSLGEQLMAVRKAALDATGGRPADPRLLELQRRAAASGASEAVPADGGFLLQPEFSDVIASRAMSQGLLLSRFTYIPVTAASANAVKVAGFDEQSRADGSRWGGVRGYWANEAASVTATKPKFRLIELLLNKLMALSYCTDELLSDTAALGAALTIAFSNELQFKYEFAALFGSGSGQPLGMLSSGNNALIVVPKDSGQAAATISATNLINMFAKLHGPSRRNALFLMSESAETQLISAAVAVKNVAGTENVGGFPLYVPATSDDAPARILGIPAVVIEGLPALGNQGDIALVDPTQYIFSDNGGPDWSSSMHVNFLSDESVFKIRWRVDGKPMWHAPLIPYGGGASLSAYVVLAAR